MILVSYAGIEEESGMDMGNVRRLYALVRIVDAIDALMVDGVSGIPYQSVSH